MQRTPIIARYRPFANSTTIEIAVQPGTHAVDPPAHLLSDEGSVPCGVDLGRVAWQDAGIPERASFSSS
jgi:hypothetical protein